MWQRSSAVISRRPEAVSWGDGTVQLPVSVLAEGMAWLAMTACSSFQAGTAASSVAEMNLSPFATACTGAGCVRVLERDYPIGPDKLY